MEIIHLIGKSSLATAISSHLGKNIYNLDIKSDKVWILFSLVPSNSVILTEDIDRYFLEIRDKKGKIIDYKPDFDLGKMMNSLDRNNINEDCLIIMTANVL